eukprot:scaffold153702_cov30-Prasinocladus_malaysianus.AAC.1
METDAAEHEYGKWCIDLADSASFYFSSTLQLAESASAVLSAVLRASYTCESLGGIAQARGLARTSTCCARSERPDFINPPSSQIVVMLLAS